MSIYNTFMRLYSVYSLLAEFWLFGSTIFIIIIIIIIIDIIMFFSLCSKKIFDTSKSL